MVAAIGSGSLAGRRIVFLNWRDFAHPQAGGAELFCHSVAERFASAGAEVILLTSRPRGLAKREHARGVQIIRRGGTLGVYPAALAWLARHGKTVDAVVDCQNGIPFFSPLVMRRRAPIVCLVHHVHQEQFRRHFPWPVSWVGRMLEGPVSRWVYGRLPLAAVSPSTRTEVRRKLRLRGPLHVVPNGMEQPAIAAEHPRAPLPRIVCVGRLVAHKRLHLLLEALPEVLRDEPALSVEIAGDGPERAALEARAAELGLGEAVAFHGRVSDEERDRLLASAWMTVMPSSHEGWGLSVLEANAHGVPALAFRVPGLRDAIRHAETGWLVDEGEPLAPALLRALARLREPLEGAAVAARCRRWAMGFSWDWTAERMAAVLLAEADRVARSEQGERRRHSDLAVRATLPPSAAQGLGLARRARRTDVWRTDADGTVAVLYGADERDVHRALARMGLEAPVAVDVARPSDLLLAGSPEPRG